MTAHEFLDDDLRDQAAHHALGTLPEPEARVYRLHLLDCATCRGEADALIQLARELVLLAPRAVPPSGLFDRVLKKVRSEERTSAGEGRGIRTSNDAASASEDQEHAQIQVWRNWAAAGATPTSRGLTYVPGASDEWQATAVAGIEMRRLFVDPATKRVTLLARMAAGTAYPAHEHVGPEECFVLQGDLRVGNVHMREGDYQHAETGSRHGLQSTDEGCLLLIVSSTEDRFTD